tara:strand:- start:395 stop:568 length:174 start_codon:yes stop_codon:yes gene_type:complete
MGEIQTSLDNSPTWIAIAWCFYPVIAMLIIEILLSKFDDDDDNDNGKMIPIYQVTQS